MHQYEIAQNTRKCFDCGSEIPAGSRFVSVLLETTKGFERRDYLRDHWRDPPADVVGIWHGKLEEPTAQNTRPAPITAQDLFNIFRHLNAQSPQNEGMIYVVSLMLLRKKEFKLHSIEHEGEKDILVLKRGKETELYRICDPKLTEEQILAAEGELTGMLSHVDAWQEGSLS